MNKSDINTREDITSLIHTFYAEVREDKLLGPIFNTMIKDWDQHLNLLVDFWETNLFFIKKYTGNPLDAHVKADKLNDYQINEYHFGIWLNLWFKNIDSLFEGDHAQLAKNRARNMSTFMNMEIFKNKPKL
jgi:hemoglobin